MPVCFVVTEHPSHLTAERRHRYERVQLLLEGVSGDAVETRHYLDPGDLGAASAVVLSGSDAPWAVHDPEALERLRARVLSFDGPVLGICAGMQLQARFAGGRVAAARGEPAVGFRTIEVVDHGGLLAGLPPRVDVYERHTDEVVDLPPGFRVLARSPACAVEAIAAPERRWWGTQFHPEAADERHPAGDVALRNFFVLAR